MTPNTTNPKTSRRYRPWFLSGLAVLVAAVGILAGDLHPFGVDARAAVRGGKPVLFHQQTSAEPFEVQVAWHGRAVVFRGSFQRGAAEAVRRAFDANPHARVLQLESGGGWVGEAVRASQMLRERGIETEAIGTCFSACSIVFAGGVKRRALPDVQIGFHTANYNGMDEAVVQRLQTRMREAYEAAGFDPALIDEIMRTPFERMWIPERSELRAARVLTD